MRTRPSAGAVVYLGPSLSIIEARRVLDADFRPPIRRGDLPDSYEGVVVIIDGEFGQNLSVSPNEILRLLDQGTRVVGAASMGALRAAELHPFGMEGYGWIFEAYRSGHVTADDEVALMYSPLDMTSLTVPLVCVRRWLDELVTASHLDSMTARRLFHRARQLFFADRSEERLRLELEKVVGPAKLHGLLSVSGGAITDIKAADARLALVATRHEILPTAAR